MLARAWFATGGAAIVVLAAGTIVALTANHSTGSHGAGTSLAARHVADNIVVPGLSPSSDCVVDVLVDGHLAYAYVDPVTSGTSVHSLTRGSTVHFAAN